MVSLPTTSSIDTALTSATERTAINESTAPAFTLNAISNAKREGLLLAVRARWVALAIIAVLVPFINPHWEVIYYLVLIGLFALIGWAQLKVGKSGWSRAELFLLFCDLALMTMITVIPNPWRTVDWPTAVQYRLDNFIYFFVLLAAGTLAYNWRTVVAMGTWTAGLWTAGLLWVLAFPNLKPELSERVVNAIGSDERLIKLLNPHNVNIDLRVQEVIVFLIVAVTLAITVRRSNNLIVTHAEVVRERANLARYFSPNVVDELSHNDEPWKQVRTQNIAVLFVDIVGFTSFAGGRDPTEVIATLREFHGAMEREVFRHHGTLDKYLGDGLMATFGTPFTGEQDASNALRCCFAMIKAVDEINQSREQSGKPAIRASFGVHYGEAVLGDIGANRLEFAVIGNTVNVASRLEGLTRQLNTPLIASDALVQKAREEAVADQSRSGAFGGLQQLPPQSIRGLETPIVVWAA